MPPASAIGRYVVARDNNVVRVDFTRQPDPPAPRFPGAGALRECPFDSIPAPEAVASSAGASQLGKALPGALRRRSIATRASQ